MTYPHIIQVVTEQDRLVLYAKDEYDVKVAKCFEKPVNWGCLLYRDYFFSYEQKFLVSNDP
jgi:hypothetical protein